MSRIFYVVLSLGIILLSCESKQGDHQRSAENETVKLVNPNTAFYIKAVVTDSARREEVVEKLTTFYRKNNSHTRWLKADEPTALFNSFLALLKNSEDYGLNPVTYRYQTIKQEAAEIYAQTSPDLDRISTLDRDITASFMLFIIHLNRGRIVETGMEEKPWNKAEKESLEVSELLNINDTTDLNAAIDSLQPDYPFYLRLRNQLRKLNYSEARDIRKVRIEDPRDFEVGYTDQNVKLIRHNLNAWGFGEHKEPYSATVDRPLIKDMKRFQDAFGLKEDGFPGERTLYYLNMNDAELKQLLALNLERLRWMPDDVEKDYLLINIPEYKLRVFEENQKQMQMKVVVGEDVNATPVFSDTLEYLVFGPKWYVPQTIVEDEMVPRLRKNPEYYTERDFIIFQDGEEIDPRLVDWHSEHIEKRYFRVVQQPGPKNALGSVKFIMPNSRSIYLHDTPADHLFTIEDRAFSHGCIRVEKPKELATYLLRENQGWDEEEVVKWMENDSTRRVNLEKLLHVQMSYLTTWVDEEGNLKIFDDVYSFDERQLAKLDQLTDYAKKF